MGVVLFFPPHLEPLSQKWFMPYIGTYDSTIACGMIAIAEKGGCE